MSLLALRVVVFLEVMVMSPVVEVMLEPVIVVLPIVPS